MTRYGLMSKYGLGGREGLMDDVGYHGFEECDIRESCCIEQYEQGQTDREAELQKAFNILMGSEYSWQEIIDKAEQLKEVNNEQSE